jgi:hypothetical protein
MKKVLIASVLIASLASCSKGLVSQSTNVKKPVQEWDTSYPIKGSQDFMILSPHKETSAVPKKTVKGWSKTANFAAGVFVGVVTFAGILISSAK